MPDAVAAFASRCAVLDARLARIETALGIAAVAAPVATAVAPPLAGGPAATSADVARLQTMLDAWTDEADSLEARITVLTDALAVLRRRPPPAPVPAPAPSALAGGVSRAALDVEQKRLAAIGDELAGLELRVGVAEDALDAFFGAGIR